MFGIQEKKLNNEIWPMKMHTCTKLYQKQPIHM